MESFRRRISILTSSSAPQIEIEYEASTNDSSAEIGGNEEDNSNDTNMNSNASSSPSQKYWMPDAVATKCYDCEAKFTTFRRRHHCRVCGQIFCSKCCGNYISGENIGCQGSVRVCNDCNDREKKRLLNVSLGTMGNRAGSSPRGSGILARPLLNVPNSGSKSSLHSDSHSASSTPGLMRHRSRTVSVFGTQGANRNFEQANENVVGNDSPAFTGKLGDRRLRKISAPSSTPYFRIGNTDLDSPMEESFDSIGGNAMRKASFSVSYKDKTKASKKLRVLVNQIVGDSKGSGVPLDTHRYAQRLYNSCFSGRELIEWLMKRDMNIQYETAFATGQALLDFNYLQDLSSTSSTQATDSSKMDFNEEKPYRPYGVKSAYDEVIIPPTTSAPLAQALTRKMTMFQDARIPLGSKELESSAFPVGALVEDEEDHIDGPEWFQDLITTDDDGTLTSMTHNLDTSASSDHSNDTILEEDEKSINGKKDSGAIFGQDLPNFKTSTSDNISIDNIDCKELDNLYLDHQREYALKLIREEKLSEKWLIPILDFISKIVSNINIDFNIGDNMDIREHVKIKRIPGGSIRDSLIINGEVFSGRVARNGMPLNLINPNLLLISESIGYPRHDKIVSLENLPAQQDEYVKNVLCKLKSFKPDVILSENGICHGTQDGLHEAKIAVILRVKRKVLERLERLFNTLTISSLDATHQPPPISTCYRYSNKSFILDNSTRRNYIVLECAEGLQSMRGCTVLLRGGSTKELACVKRVLRRMLLVKQSARFEKAFLLTEYCQIDRFSHKNSFHDSNLMEMTLSPFVTIPDTSISNEEDDSENSLLTMKTFDSGLTGEEADSNCENSCDSDSRNTNNRQIDIMVQEDTGQRNIVKNNGNLNGKMVDYVSNQQPELITAILTTGLEDRKVRNMLADFRANNYSRFKTEDTKNDSTNFKIGYGDSKSIESVPAYYKDLEDKRLPLVYSSHSPVSRVSPQYCVKPWVTGMGFYDSGDIPIGAYLEDFCFSDESKCPNEECVSPLRDHIRRFVLEDICITLKVQEAEENMMVLNVDENTIQTWRYCPICKLVTPIVLLNSDAWMFSFATFFLLLIYEDSLKRRGGTYDICKHPLHREHHICFLKGNMLASFKVSRIQLRDLVMPSPQLQMPSKDPTKEELRSDLNDVNIHRDEMFTQINEKLSKIKVDTSSQILITSITTLISDCAKDYESLQKLGDGIFTNIKDNTQLAEMRISILMLKVQLLKTISTWKQKLAHLGDLKKKEEKSTHSALSRHPSGNNVSTLTTSALTQQLDMAHNSASHIPSDSSKCQTTDNHKLLCPDVNIKDQNNETKDTLTTHSDSSIEKNIEDINATNDSVVKESKTIEARKSSSMANTQPLSNQIIAQSSKHKWHSRDSNISTSNFQLSSPFPATLHADLYLKPGVLVDESQPSSIIAYTLASNDYRNFVETSTTQFLLDNETKQQKSSIDINKKDNSTTEKHESTKAKDTDDQSKHFKHSFRDDSCDFFCKVLFAHDFELFRGKTLSSKTDLILSLSKCSRFKASGGKSGVKFYKTADDRFLLKELNRRTEARDVSTFIPKYLNYMTRAHEGAGNSLLAKIIGVFDVGFKNHVTGSQSGIMFILMENLTYGRSNITGSYDLKGSRRRATIKTLKKNSDSSNKNTLTSEMFILKDEDFIKSSTDNPFWVSESNHRIVMTAINNDAKFLTDNNIMDYSMLVFKDEVANQLIVGIVDYIRTYTWDKRVESLIKRTLRFFAKENKPSIIPPIQYQHRFEISMTAYFYPAADYIHDNQSNSKPNFYRTF